MKRRENKVCPKQGKKHHIFVLNITYSKAQIYCKYKSCIKWLNSPEPVPVCSCNKCRVRGFSKRRFCVRRSFGVDK